MSDQQGRARRKRERYLVDAQLQWALALPLLAILVVIALAHTAAIYLFAGDSALRAMTTEEGRRLFLGANIIYYALATAALGSVTIFLTHRIAGPARIIERAVRGLQRGDYEERLALRPRDDLKPLATAVTELRNHLRERDDRRRYLLQEVASRLEENDLVEARKLLVQLEQC